jgi:hypothetical protein
MVNPGASPIPTSNYRSTRVAAQIRHHPPHQRTGWHTIDELDRAVQAFLGPVLGRSETGSVWSPVDWYWSEGA